jgi:predicted RNA polymerase sigma factor
VPLGEQDRSRWDTSLITEGVTLLQAALARDRLGAYQAQAAIAALHADARSASETDWAQIVEWYDELLRLTDSPVVRLNRAVGMRQDSERTQALARIRPLFPSFDRGYATCSTAHTSPQRSWKSRRWSARETASFMR